MKDKIWEKNEYHFGSNPAAGKEDEPMQGENEELGLEKVLLREEM